MTMATDCNRHSVIDPFTCELVIVRAGTDRLYGGAGVDAIFGVAGNDYLCQARHPEDVRTPTLIGCRYSPRRMTSASVTHADPSRVVRVSTSA